MVASPGKREVRLDRKGFKVRRKVFHLFLGAFFAIMVITDRGLIWPLIVVLVLGLMLSFFQERWPFKPLKWLLDRYDKGSDLVPGQGPITFFLGSLLAWSLFPREAAIAAVVVLTFGDPMASTVGTLLGGKGLPWNRRKTLAGSIGFTIVPALLLSLKFGPAAGIAVSVAGAVAESLPLPEGLIFDDNVTVPVLSGAFAAFMGVLFPSVI